MQLGILLEGWGFAAGLLLAVLSSLFVWTVIILTRALFRKLYFKDAASGSKLCKELKAGPLELFEAGAAVLKGLGTFTRVMKHVLGLLHPRCGGRLIAQQIIVIAVAIMPYLNSLTFGYLLDEIQANHPQNTTLIIAETIVFSIVCIWWLFDPLEKKLTYDLEQHFRQMFTSYFPEIRNRCGMQSFQSGNDMNKMLSSAERGEYFVKFFVVFSMSMIGGLLGSIVGASAIIPKIAIEPALVISLALLLYLLIRLHASMKMSLFEESNYSALGEMTNTKGNFGKKELFKGIVAFGIGGALIRRLNRLADEVFPAQRKLSWQLAPRELFSIIVLLAACGFAGHSLIRDSIENSVPVGRIAFLVGSMLALIRSLKALIEGFGLQVLGIQKMDDLTKFTKNPSLILPPLGGNQSFPIEGPVGIAVETLDYTYPGASAPALRQLSFAIEAGNALFLQAGNGVGKTTIYNLLQLLFQPPTGKIFLTNEIGERADLANLRLDETRQFIRHLGQSTLEMKHTVRESLAMAAGIDESSELARSTEIESRMWNCLSYACLEDRVRQLKKKLDEPLAVFRDAREDLSGGQHRKLNIAMLFMAILSGGARIVILDEPFTGVEPRHAKQILRNFRTLCQELRITLLITTHAMSEIPEEAPVLAFFREEDAQGVLQKTAVEIGKQGALLASSPRYREYAGTSVEHSW